MSGSIGVLAVRRDRDAVGLRPEWHADFLVVRVCLKVDERAVVLHGHAVVAGCRQHELVEAARVLRRIELRHQLSA